MPVYSEKLHSAVNKCISFDRLIDCLILSSTEQQIRSIAPKMLASKRHPGFKAVQRHFLKIFVY